MKTYMRLQSRVYWGAAALGLAFALLFSQPAFAGTLGEFEQEATEDDDEKNRPRRYYDDDDDDCHGFFACLFRGIFHVIFWDDDDDDDEHYSRNQEQSYRGDDEHAWNERRNSGGSTIFTPWSYNPVLTPAFRLDGSYQNVESDVEALDFRTELGFGWAGFQGRFTHYEEDYPDDDLWMVYLHGLFRVPMGDSVQMSIGPGAIILDGDDENSGFSLTSSFLVYPQESVGIEFRPTWSWIEDGEDIDDYDLSVVWGGRHFAARAGYRWVDSDDTVSLDGPYIGATFRF